MRICLALLESLGVPPDVVTLEPPRTSCCIPMPRHSSSWTASAPPESASLDDFGTGYSSLSHLHSFDMDLVKIDRRFVASLRPGTKNFILCQIILIAHALGLEVVAEGIETQEQHDLLLEMGATMDKATSSATPPQPTSSADGSTRSRAWRPSQHECPFDLPAHTHYLVIAGSRSHGLHTPESDVDLKGVALPPRAQPRSRPQLRAVRSSRGPRPLHEPPCPEEIVAGQAAGLEGTICSGSPAWPARRTQTSRRCCSRRRDPLPHPGRRLLREHRQLFLSARCLQTFSGYATQQLGRITRHHRWHHDGPSGAPERADFDLPERTLLPRSHLEAAESAIRKQLALGARPDAPLSDQRIEVTGWLARVLAEMGVGSDDRASAARTVGLGDDLIEILKRERYRAARDERRYQGWMKNRNPARAARGDPWIRHQARCSPGAASAWDEIATQGRCIVWDRDTMPTSPNHPPRCLELRAARRLAEQQGRARNLAASQLAVPPTPNADAIRALVLRCVEAAL